MRHRFRLLPLVCAALATPVAGLAAGPAVALAGGPASETVYIQGDTAEINAGAAVIFDASAGMLRTASPIYLIEFPVAPGTTGPITLPSGYQPQHNGFPPSPIPYHDHVIAGAPGTSSTSALYTATLRVVPMRYSWTYAYSPAFVPITSADQIAGAEAAGKLEIINPGASDPYQISTTTILVRPVLPGR